MSPNIEASLAAVTAGATSVAILPDPIKAAVISLASAVAAAVVSYLLNWLRKKLP